MHELQTEMTLDRPVDQVFAFFARPENLAKITPPWLRFRILTPSPIPMATGTRIRYRIWLGPIPMAWDSEITGYQDGARFVDEQVRGPYRSWKHTHAFLPLDGGRTLVRDRVEYVLPLGWIGRVIERVAVRYQLKAIFGYRQQALAKIFPPASDPDHGPDGPSGPRLVASGEGTDHPCGHGSSLDTSRRSAAS